MNQTPSNPNIELPPSVRAGTNSDLVPQLPPSVAKHPVYATIVIVVSMIASLLGGVYALVPSDTQVTNLKTAVDSLSDDVTELKHSVQRSQDKADTRIERIERDLEAIRRYHDRVDLWMTDLNTWQFEVKQHTH